MTSVKMLFSYNNSEKVVEVPIIPDELPDIIEEMQNESFTTHTKTLTLLGNKKPRSFSLDLFLPTRDYEFCEGNGREVIDFFEYVTSAKLPARLVITDRLTELLNIAISIKSYKYHYDTVGNIRAVVECVEYEFITEPKLETVSNAPVFSEIIVYYNGSSAQVKAANINGSNLVKTRDIINLLGREVWWNADKKRVGCGKVLLDIHTEIYDGTAYSYIRDITKMLNLDVEYNTADKSVILKDGD